MFIRSLLIPLVVGSVLMGSAGQVELWALWLYPAVLWVAFGVVWTQASQELIKERQHPPSDRDRGTRLTAMACLLAHFAVAGLDVGRFHWSAMPIVLQVTGFGLVLAGFGMVGWTLIANPYASTAVRIQEERGHQVITAGPYALVRHPMYLGTFLFFLGSPLALGSWWSGLLVLRLAPLFVRRTLLEDRMLHDELDGYPQYARRVRARILPGVF